jgi:hypothetical protein
MPNIIIYQENVTKIQTYPFAYTMIAIIKNKRLVSIGKDVEKVELSYIAGGI